MLKTYKTCNSMVRFSKYEFYNKLLGNVTLLRITPDVNFDKSTTRLYYFCIFSILTKLKND